MHKRGVRTVEVVIMSAILVVAAACASSGNQSTNKSKTSVPGTENSMSGDHAQTNTTTKGSATEPAASGEPLKVGVIVSPPSLFLDTKTNTYYGPAITLVEAEAKALKRPISYVQTSFDTLVAGLQTGQLDMVAVPLYETPERAKAIDFVTWAESGSCWAVLKTNTSINTLADLNNPKLTAALVAGSGPATSFSTEYPETKTMMVHEVGSVFPLDEVISGRADFTHIDATTIYTISKKYPQFKFIPAGDNCIAHPDLSTALGLGIQKGNPNKKLMQDVADSMADKLVAERIKYIESTKDGQ